MKEFVIGFFAGIAAGFVLAVAMAQSRILLRGLYPVLIASQAVPIIDSLVKANPGDPQYLRTRWLVLRSAKQYKKAVEAGQAYVTAASTISSTRAARSSRLSA